MNITITTKENSDYKVVEPKKEELSACGKTKAEFFEACKPDCSNVEFNERQGEWKRTLCSRLSDLIGLNTFACFANYRIKPTPTPKLDNLPNGCEIELRNGDIHYNLNQLNALISSELMSEDNLSYTGYKENLCHYIKDFDIMKITSPDGELIWERGK